MENAEVYQEQQLEDQQEDAETQEVPQEEDAQDGNGDKRARGGDDSRSGKRQKLQDGEAKQECKFWLKGSCKFGSKCRSLHDPDGPLKAQAKAAGKELCKFYQTGKCKFGDKCKAFHPHSLVAPSSISAFRPNFNPLSPGMLQQQLAAATQLQQQLQQQLLLSQQQRRPASVFSPFLSPFSMGIQSQKASLRSSSSSALPAFSSLRSSNSAKRSKTEPCKYFLKGDCKFGQRCELSHDISISSAGSTRIEPVVIAIRPVPVVTPAPLTLRAASAAQKSSKDPNQLCEHFLRGGCKFGSSCRQRHSATTQSSVTAGNLRLRSTSFPQAFVQQHNPYLPAHQQQPNGLPRQGFMQYAFPNR